MIEVFDNSRHHYLLIKSGEFIGGLLDFYKVVDDGLILVLPDYYILTIKFYIMVNRYNSHPKLKLLYDFYLICLRILS